jgi:hypothetical protein
MEQLKLSKAEVKHLLSSLNIAYRNGMKEFRTPEGFLAYLDGECGFYLLRAREYERKSKSLSFSALMRQSHARIAKKLRREARIGKRLHTKIVNYRKINAIEKKIEINQNKC